VEGQRAQHDSRGSLSVGWRIQRLRVGAGMSQAELATATGLSKSYIS
jgi:DNA-binding XRE family transcriptional regulator